jgi:hypothetical protein
MFGEQPPPEPVHFLFSSVPPPRDETNPDHCVDPSTHEMTCCSLSPTKGKLMALRLNQQFGFAQLESIVSRGEEVVRQERVTLQGEWVKPQKVHWPRRSMRIEGDVQKRQ